MSGAWDERAVQPEAVPSCGSCGTALPPQSRFCNKCGEQVKTTATAEYKQVTVLFADVVHSMEIAVAVGPERLREIMTALVTRCAGVVQRYGGTPNQFTGDGLMAVFGAPVALEDHATRACHAALAAQEEAKRLAVDVWQRDGIELQIRVGLNSGEVIAGEIGAGHFGYTAVGEQVGMAQRMEAVAPPGGVVLSASTARLVEGVARLGEPEMVRIKGADSPVPARQLLGMNEHHRGSARVESRLAGRHTQMSALEGLLDRAIDGHGVVAGVVGPPGIGKSRLVRELSALAAHRRVEMFTVFCESHASQVPFYAVARLLRSTTGVTGLGAREACDRLRALAPRIEAEDLLLLGDLVGIGDPDADLSHIDPDARRRRLTAALRAMIAARNSPAIYVIEDAHWIDLVSESMIADLLDVIPQTRSLVLVTYRPEYVGALTQGAEGRTIPLDSLSDSDTMALTTTLLGTHPSVAALSRTIADRAAGNPFFAEEIVRDLAERGVIAGTRAAYVSTLAPAEVSVPATLHAVIAARIDRLDARAKATLCAAAVVGSRFSGDLLLELGIEAATADLVAAQLVDRVVESTRRPEFVFHHPLIRAVAYESQLKSERARMHQRVAAVLERHDPASTDENAAMIAEHLEAAGDFRAAYGWHMRAATWARSRDIAAARRSWERAKAIADELPAAEPGRSAMRIGPRTMLCGTDYRAHNSGVGVHFAELRQLCAEAGDQSSLAIAMAGLVMDHAYQGRVREASLLAAEAMAHIDSLGDPTLTVGLSFPVIYAKIESGEWSEVLRCSQRVVELADGDAVMGSFIFGSPLALALTSRGIAQYFLGHGGWTQDLRDGLVMARSTDPLTYAAVVAWAYFPGILNGVLVADDRAVQEIEDAVRTAERSGNDMALAFARMALGVALIHRQTEAERSNGQALLAEVSCELTTKAHNLADRALIAVYLAREHAAHENRDQAVVTMRAAVNELVREGQLLAWGTPAIGVLVETLLERGGDDDIVEAEAAIDRLAAAPVDERLVLRELWLLRMRSKLAHAHGDDAAYRDCRDRYRTMARMLRFEGHMRWADAMP